MDQTLGSENSSENIMDSPIVDFHVHYNPDKPEETFELIKNAPANLVAMGLVARGEVSNQMAEFIEYGKRERNIDIVPGVELQTNLGDESVEVIGLDFDPKSPIITNWLSPEADQKRCIERAKVVSEFLQNKGYSFEGIEDDPELMEIMQKLREGVYAEISYGLSYIVSRLKQNKALIDRDKAAHEPEWQTVQDRYKGKPGYDETLDPRFLYRAYFAQGKEGNTIRHTPTQEVINRLHAAGGVALYSPEGHYSREIWDGLDQIGIDGIMGWHGGVLGWDPVQQKVDIPRKDLVDMHKNGKLILGGSDYQGKDWKLGVGTGDMHIDTKRWEELKEKQRAARTVNTVLA